MIKELNKEELKLVRGGLDRAERYVFVPLEAYEHIIKLGVDPPVDFQIR